MSSYKLINYIFEPRKEEKALLHLLNYVKRGTKDSTKLIITLFSHSNFSPPKNHFSHNLISAEDFKMASLLEYRLQEKNFDCQLIDGSRLFPLSQKNKTKKWQLFQLSFKRKISAKTINIIVFNRIDPIPSPQFLFRKLTLPLRLGQFLKIKSCEVLLPKDFYKNSLNLSHVAKHGKPNIIELSYSELIDMLTYSDKSYFSPDFVHEAKNKEIFLSLFSHGENIPRYQIKTNKEISGELVHWIKATTDVCRFIFVWRDKIIFHQSIPHLFHILAKGDINTFGTQSTTVADDMHILSMFIERKNVDEVNTLFEYNKKVLGYENISQENRIGIIDIIGQKFHSSSRVVAQIATLMTNRPYTFHITGLNSNHIRLCMEIDFIKKATQLLTDELI